jgi:hypothetical protein
MGYWRFQKRKQLAAGVRLNLSKRGAGVSLGRRGASVSVGPRGLGAAVTLLCTGLTYVWRKKKR